MSEHPRLTALKETAGALASVLEAGEVGLSTWHAAVFRLVSRLALQADVAETIRDKALKEAAEAVSRLRSASIMDDCIWVGCREAAVRTIRELAENLRKTSAENDKSPPVSADGPAKP
jgi:predicted aconitase